MCGWGPYAREARVWEACCWLVQWCNKHVLNCLITLVPDDAQWECLGSGSNRLQTQPISYMYGAGPIAELLADMNGNTLAVTLQSNRSDAALCDWMIKIPRSTVSHDIVRVIDSPF